MVSSTFWDLEQHRAKLMSAISGQGLHPVAMEQDAALPAGTGSTRPWRRCVMPPRTWGLLASGTGKSQRTTSGIRSGFR
jgi:hypothetical protein